MLNKIDCQLPIELHTDSNVKYAKFVLEYRRGENGKIAEAWATNIGIDCDGEFSLISGLKIDLEHHDDLDLLRTFFKGLDIEKIISTNA